MRTNLTLLTLTLIAKNAWAIDLQPGEIVAPQPDKSVMQVSYVHNQFDGNYKDYDKQPGDLRYSAVQQLIRVARSFQLADMPAIIYAQTSHANINLKGNLSPLKDDSGIGDTSFLFAVWPYANRETDTYFGIGAYLITPTGSYDHNRIFNVGENRFRYALQAGFQTPISERIDVMTAVDGIVYGDNHSYGINKQNLSQDHLYTAQLGLRYKLNPQYHFGINFFHTEGGNQEVDSQSRDNSIQLNRYQFSAIGNYSFGRVTLQYGQDFDTKNGFKEDSRFIVRYTVAF